MLLQNSSLDRINPDSKYSTLSNYIVVACMNMHMRGLKHGKVKRVIILKNVKQPHLI